MTANSAGETSLEMISISHWGMFPAPQKIRRLEEVLPIYPKKRAHEFFSTEQVKR